MIGLEKRELITRQNCILEGKRLVTNGLFILAERSITKTRRGKSEVVQRLIVTTERIGLWNESQSHGVNFSPLFPHAGRI